MQFVTCAICNTYNLQQIQFASCAINNTCNLQHMQFATLAIYNTYKTNQLDETDRRISWKEQLDRPAGWTGWTDQLDGPVLYTWSHGQWPVRILEDWPFSLSQLPSLTKALFFRVRGQNINFVEKNYCSPKWCFVWPSNFFNRIFSEIQFWWKCALWSQKHKFLSNE